VFGKATPDKIKKGINKMLGRDKIDMSKASSSTGPSLMARMNEKVRQRTKTVDPHSNALGDIAGPRTYPSTEQSVRNAISSLGKRVRGQKDPDLIGMKDHMNTSRNPYNNMVVKSSKRSTGKNNPFNGPGPSASAGSTGVAQKVTTSKPPSSTPGTGTSSVGSSLKDMSKSKMARKAAKYLAVGYLGAATGALINEKTRNDQRNS
jgi:hypothetical protein